jgi:hypothetical protein
MNLKFLQSINEDHEKRMDNDEMKSYLELLYKKCSKGIKKEFDDYLKKECDLDEVDFAKCAEIICKDEDRCDKVIHHLENLSNKVDENSLSSIMTRQYLDEVREQLSEKKILPKEYSPSTLLEDISCFEETQD